MRCHTLAILGALLAAGCGVSRDEFVPDYAQGYCDYLLECGDQAQLTFDGVLTVDDCVAVFGPEVQEQADVCRFRHGEAKDCLDLLSIAECPADHDVDAALPAACLQVFENCPPLAGAEDPT